jgi:2-amino-4-hydroxy-6-hydroxymethyldihydropteridine diphosphokinase
MKSSLSLNQVFIGLGSNLDIPTKQLQKALRSIANIPKVRVSAVSHFYWSKPLYWTQPEPGAESPDYVNAVAKIFTSLPPLELLHQLQNIEHAQDRKREKKWGERTIDLDIILYERLQIKSEVLTIPHPGIYDRNFWLHPLHEIAPTLHLPDETSIAELAVKLGREGLRFCRAFGIEELIEEKTVAVV